MSSAHAVLIIGRRSSKEPCDGVYESSARKFYRLVRVIVFSNFLGTLGIINSKSRAVNPAVAPSRVAGRVFQRRDSRLNLSHESSDLK